MIKRRVPYEELNEYLWNERTIREITDIKYHIIFNIVY